MKIAREQFWGLNCYLSGLTLWLATDLLINFIICETNTEMLVFLVSAVFFRRNRMILNETVGLI